MSSAKAMVNGAAIRVVSRRSHGRVRVASLTLVLLALSLVVSACPVRFVSDYDPVLDRTATKLQTQLDTFVVKMQAAAGTPEGEYGHNKAFYEDMVGALRALHSRAEVMPKNEITIQQIELLQANPDNLRPLHEQSGKQGLPAALAGPAQAALDANFRAIIKFEAEKRRGK
jgi:hypothetical protein